jgi:hypothetical protein
MRELSRKYDSFHEIVVRGDCMINGTIIGTWAPHQWYPWWHGAMRPYCFSLYFTHLIRVFQGSHLDFDRTSWLPRSRNFLTKGLSVECTACSCPPAFRQVFEETLLGERSDSIYFWWKYWVNTRWHELRNPRHSMDWKTIDLSRQDAQGNERWSIFKWTSFCGKCLKRWTPPSSSTE